MTGTKSLIFRFADVEIREREFSLVKSGEVLPVEPKAFRVLLILLRNPQKLITKEELLNTVWGDAAVTENSLTRSIALLRRLLGDETRNPRYIETVATVGYRFMCPVEASEDTSHKSKGNPILIDSEIAPPDPPLKGFSMRRLLWAAGGVALAGAVVAIAFFLRWYSLPRTPVIDGVSQLTDDGNPKLLSNLVSDGSRIYFNEIQGGKEILAQVAASGGQTGQIASNAPDHELTALAPDSLSLLMRGTRAYAPFWILPLPAGEPRKLPGAWQDASFFPNGQLAFTKDRSLYVAEKDGSNPRKVFDFPDQISNPVVSPNGKSIRLNVVREKFTGSIWEVNTDGTGAHPLMQEWQDAGDLCCGRWTSDGRYFVFQSRRHGRTDLWVLPEASRWFGRPSLPIRLTNGPLSYHFPFPSQDGKHLYAFGSKQRGELVRYNQNSKEFIPYLSGISAMDATVSRDGQWVAYMSYPGRDLWRSRVDGGERLQLTFPPTSVYYPRISPDGTKVAYGALDENGTGCAYVLSMEGGTPRKIAERARGGASWSPDSNSVVFNLTDRTGVGLNFLGVETVDLRTGKTYAIPDSTDTGGPFWPTPNMLVALRWKEGPIRFATFDFKTQKWTELGKLIPNRSHWMQSVDRKYLYYSTRGDDPEVGRVDLQDGKIEAIASLKNFRPAEDEDFGDWLGVAPDGSPLLTRDIGTQEIYDLSVQWH